MNTQDEIVGHKTLRAEDGTLSHVPLYKSEADRLLAHVKEQEELRHKLMPDEQSALNMLFDAWLRLKELGWREAYYCPKDGTLFEVIEAGSTGIFDCYYEDNRGVGRYWTLSGDDTWPSSPILYREKK